MSLPYRNPQPVWRRYLLFQLPGWILAAILLGALRAWFGLTLLAALLLLAAVIAKDLIVYPRLRRAYEQDSRTQVERLIGQRAVVAQTLNPVGFIRVRGELWSAAVRPEHAPLAAGLSVVIETAERWTLIVKPAPTEES